MTTEEIADPFAGADIDDDEFATPQSEFLGLADLDGRLLVIDALEIKEMNGVDGPYNCVVANVLVLDGEPLDLLPQVPGTVSRMYISASNVVGQIEGNAGKRRPFLCRPDVQVNKRKQRVVGVRKHEITDADKALAAPFWRKYKAAL